MSCCCSTKTQLGRRVFPEFVSNGPYILKDRKIKSHITLEKNPLYRDIDDAKTDKIQFAIVEEPQTAYNMFEEALLTGMAILLGACR